jgi:hypothetical protein
MCACVDLGLWIKHPDLGQPSQTSDHRKNVKASMNSPTYRRWQRSQSTMGTETRWIISQNHQQYTSSSSMSTFSNASARQSSTESAIAILQLERRASAIAIPQLLKECCSTTATPQFRNRNFFCSPQLESFTSEIFGIFLATE